MCIFFAGSSFLCRKKKRRFSSGARRIPLPSRGSFLYGLIAGLLPVVALAVLTALVPIVIRMVAIK